MAKIPPRTPVSDELIEAIISRFKTGGFTLKVLDMRRGKNKAEVIFSTTAGEVPCLIKEDDLFLIFEMPSGKNNLCIPKGFMTEFTGK